MSKGLIGRDHPAAVLRAEIERATSSHGGLVLVTGEAGIGKTTLLAEAMEQARQSGMRVLSGACWDSDSAPGYWPWVQVVRGLRRGMSAQDWSRAATDAGPALPTLLGESGAAEHIDDFALYDAVTTLLASASLAQPLLVVLDDLHWADAASVKLLEFAAQHTWFERLLLVGAYRDVEVDSPQHRLRPLLAPLNVKATTVVLPGLEPEAVAELMTRTLGSRPDDALSAEVHRRTGGNPFFVEQSAQLWHSEGAGFAAAPGVAEAVQRRLALLPGPVRQVLATASVLGQQFHRGLLAAVAAEPVPHVDRLLDQAATARLVTPCGGGRFGFAHDLVREVLHDGLDPDEQARLHAGVVAAADDSTELAAHVLPAQLAGHAGLAGRHVSPDKTVALLVHAADDAAGRLAADEALGHITRARNLLDEVAPRERAKYLLHLGSLLHHGGANAEGWQLLRSAVELARTIGDPALLARAAITVNQAPHRHENTQFQADALREAYRSVTGKSGSAAEVSLQHIEQELTIHIAVTARRGSDDEALAFGLLARHDSIWEPGTAAERLAIIDEVLVLTRRAGDSDPAHLASSLRWVALLELDDPAYLPQLREFVAAADQAQPHLSALSSNVDTAVIDTQAGRFDAADVALQHAETASEHYGGHLTYITQHVRWAWLMRQGRFGEAATLLRAIAVGNHPHARLLEALTAVESGDIASATRFADAFDREPKGFSREVGALRLWFQARLAEATGDARRCEQARRALTPHLGQWLVSLHGCDVNGPVTYWVAAIDAAQSRWEAAESGFAAALASAERMQLPTWALEARLGLARAMSARDDPAGAAMLDSVESEAAELGMRQLGDRVHRARDTAPAGAAAATAVKAQFRREGAVWSLDFDGVAVHMPDSKGLRDLHVLLGSPGADVPAVQLLDPSGGQETVAAHHMGADAVLDAEAKANYRRQLQRLDEEIDRAERRGDERKAVAFDAERQALLQQLRAAAGLGGRDRRLGDDAERARKTVSARVKDAIRKLDSRHPALAAHLRATVSTGAVCSYQPEQPVPWQL